MQRDAATIQDSFPPRATRLSCHRGGRMPISSMPFIMAPGVMWIYLECRLRLGFRIQGSGLGRMPSLSMLSIAAPGVMWGEEVAWRRIDALRPRKEFHDSLPPPPSQSLSLSLSLSLPAPPPSLSRSCSRSRSVSLSLTPRLSFLLFLLPSLPRQVCHAHILQHPAARHKFRRLQWAGAHTCSGTQLGTEVEGRI